MKAKRRKKILRFVSNRVGSGVCSCCGYLKLITIRFKKVKLCLKCMIGTAELFNLPVMGNAASVSTKSKRMPTADFSKEELREMSNGAMRVVPKHKKKRFKGKYIMDGGIPKLVGGKRRPDSNFQWGEGAGSEHFSERMGQAEGEWG